MSKGSAVFQPVQKRQSPQSRSTIVIEPRAGMLVSGLGLPPTKCVSASFVEIWGKGWLVWVGFRFLLGSGGKNNQVNMPTFVDNFSDLHRPHIVHKNEDP